MVIHSFAPPPVSAGAGAMPTSEQLPPYGNPSDWRIIPHRIDDQPRMAVWGLPDGSTLAVIPADEAGPGRAASIATRLQAAAAAYERAAIPVYRPRLVDASVGDDPATGISTVTQHPASKTEQMLRLGFRYRSRTNDGRFEGVSYERVLSGMLRVAVLVDAIGAPFEGRRFAAPRWEIATRDAHGAWQLLTAGDAPTIEAAAIEATDRAVDAMALAMRLVQVAGRFASMLTETGGEASLYDQALGRAHRPQ